MRTPIVGIIFFVLAAIILPGLRCNTPRTLVIFPGKATLCPDSSALYFPAVARSTIPGIAESPSIPDPDLWLCGMSGPHEEAIELCVLRTFVDGSIDPAFDRGDAISFALFDMAASARDCCMSMSHPGLPWECYQADAAAEMIPVSRIFNEIGTQFTQEQIEEYHPEIER